MWRETNALKFVYVNLEWDFKWQTFSAYDRRFLSRVAGKLTDIARTLEIVESFGNLLMSRSIEAVGGEATNAVRRVLEKKVKRYPVAIR